jgi:exopolysaccharide biosynthesis polyprenyl glycosylphosphotransferase
MPVAIHLGASSLIGRFSEARVSRLDTLSALSLTAPPLGPIEVAAKRAFDVFVAALALVLLSPIFAAIALAIKATSPGPVFFRQRRRGYNNREFRIWKFRTMTALDDGPHIEQARVNDARVTSIGRYLRRFNLDELPQLLNVLRGEMSLVGPRPHAVAHDQIYEKRIGSYPRRLNVKPGITGWAQVNGYRGRTETDEDMRARVEYDLYYIDNWSILFDLYIIVLTVLSPKAFRNAH